MSQTTEGTVSLLTVPHNERLTELRANQLSRDVWGSSGPLLGMHRVGAYTETLECQQGNQGNSAE